MHEHASGSGVVLDGGAQGGGGLAREGVACDTSDAVTACGDGHRERIRASNEAFKEWRVLQCGCDCGGWVLIMLVLLCGRAGGVCGRGHGVRPL